MGRSLHSAVASADEPEPPAAEGVASVAPDAARACDPEASDPVDLDEEDLSEPTDIDTSERGQISLLLQQMGATSLLSREQEQALAHELVAAREAILQHFAEHGALLASFAPELVAARQQRDDFRERDALDLLDRLPLSPATPETDGFADELRRRVARYRRLRDRFLRANLRLVVSLARRYRRPGVAIPDLVQEGILGLVRAIEKFDPVRDVKFATYAVWWIWQQIGRAGDLQSAIIRTPVHWNQLRRRLGRETVRLEIEQGGSVERSLIAEATGIDTERLEAVSQTLYCVSLDAPLDDDDRSLADLLASPAPDPEHERSAADLSKQLEAALDRLPQRDADILRLRFGTTQQPAMTLEEVGQALGLSRERVRQLEARALRILLPICQRQGLREYID